MKNSNELAKQLRKYIENSVNNQVEKRISIDAIDGLTRISLTGNFSLEYLYPIMIAVNSQYLGSYYIGTEIFLELFNQYSELQEILINLASSRLAHERWVALTLVRDERIPDEIAYILIKKGIDDKSIKVRLLAIESVYTRDVSSLVDTLNEKITSEKNEKVLCYLEWVIERMK